MVVDRAKVSPAPPAPAAVTAEAGQEIRFAVVMYGGISLAIYIHGVAQELLRVVRATSGADLGRDEVAKIYQELSCYVRDQSQPDAPCVKTRFVIDILSGTSAGGINAVFLAKALAIRSHDLDHLRRTWLDAADIDKILNRGAPREPKRSLLNGAWMYEQLYNAFVDMNNGPVDGLAGYTPVEQLDLFVTTTDLNGVSIPIHLADKDVLEKVHRGSFNFRRDDIILGRGPRPAALDVELDTLIRKDFEPELDGMLAFACRCTSSFPIAFAPMKLADIAPAVGRGEYPHSAQQYRKFFRWIPTVPLIKPQNPLAFDERELADGGYLDNKPFGLAIDALSFRATSLRHTRKLLFVDPFPELAAEAVDQPHFDFIENTVAGSISLPHYQTIREEIDRVKTSNRTQTRLQALQDRTMPSLPPGEFQELTVRELAGTYGVAYRTYHAVRLMDCTDDLARMFGGLPASAQSEDAVLAVRYLVRAWREATYAPNGEGGRQLETRFFTDFDFSFRLRRAAHLLEFAQTRRSRNPELCDLLIRHLTRIQRRRAQLALSGDANPIWPEIAALRPVVTWANIQTILEPVDDLDRLARASDLYEGYKDKFQAMAAALARRWDDVFSLNRTELREARAADPVLDRMYLFFDYHDMVSLAFLEGSDVSEHTQTEIYRISPADGIQRSLRDKLAGYAVGGFGAFLKREWRENDILWGRLDACERIVSAVLSHGADKERRDSFVRRLQDAIVQQEADVRPEGQANDLALAVTAIGRNRLPEYLTNQYSLPTGPTPGDSARRIAEAADIFGRMVEEDVGVKNQATGFLRSAGGLAARLVGLVTPGTLGRVFWNYWLVLVGLAAGLLLVYAWIAGDSHARILGARGIAAVLVTWFLSWVIGRLLARAGVPFWIRPLKLLPAIVLAVLVLIGALHLPQDASQLWRHIRYGPGP